MSRTQTARGGSGSFDAILRRLAMGDRQALAEAYDRVAPALYRIARARGMSEAAGESFVEDVLLDMWRTARRFPAQDRSPVEWVLRLADDVLRTMTTRTGRDAG